MKKDKSVQRIVEGAVGQGADEEVEEEVWSKKNLLYSSF